MHMFWHWDVRAKKKYQKKWGLSVSQVFFVRRGQGADWSVLYSEIERVKLPFHFFWTHLAKGRGLSGCPVFVCEQTSEADRWGSRQALRKVWPWVWRQWITYERGVFHQASILERLLTAAQRVWNGCKNHAVSIAIQVPLRGEWGCPLQQPKCKETMRYGCRKSLYVARLSFLPCSLHLWVATSQK